MTGLTVAWLIKAGCAIVESAAAITEALFELAGAYQNFDPEDITTIGYRIGDIADAIEKLAPAK